MYLIQLLLPAVAPSPESDAVIRTRAELADAFGGVTAYTRAPAQGVWISPEGNRQRDEMVMVEVLADELDRRWWQIYISTLAARFQQREIHIRAIPAERL